MDSQSANNFPGDVQKDTEPIRSDSEQPPLFSVAVRNDSESIPKKIEVRSEAQGNHSEGIQDTQASITKDVQNGSDAVPKERKVDSEIDRSRSEPIRNPSEPYRTAPMCSEQHEGFSITVREAARIFEEAGAPRTERAITNWCNRNARGITRLACCYNEGERKYYLSPQSIERVIKEERKKIQYVEYKEGGLLSAQAEDLSEQVRDERGEVPERETPADRARGVHDGTTHAHRLEPDIGTGETGQTEQWSKAQGESDAMNEDERARLKELQMQNYELQVQLEGQKYLVRKFDDLVAGERERHEREKLALVDRLTDARYRIGSLEEKLLRLDAPTASVRDVETEDRGEETHTAKPGPREQE